ncbi:FKBP-type peptidyl-prolyl cis-trans isomerase [Allopusillimonas ginsengisoli]|uniref:FKBP-type peptidyl-prolyl cis-trans isomerase n=1 Tax=Allopusillimonas ginsengisoli TaxID=453575 RepID=UPI001020327C|nr:FKBP-type peptidyl-prolyl cis-trans isomerase [Allopusillimonas ginsengisoli]TEA79516.1 peptidylprolyl isomerase [Allopusillimonas ginsengisoli]
MTTSSDPAQAIVRPDSYLTLHYRIQLVSGPAAGEVFADTFGGNPATLQMGAGQWAPGMEEALLGQPEGARFSVDLPAAQAYGERNPDLVQRVSRAVLDEHAAADSGFTPGDMVEFTAPNGGRYSGVLKQLDEQSALFDFNHPLAGADLRIEVSLLGVM